MKQVQGRIIGVQTFTIELDSEIRALCSGKWGHPFNSSFFLLFVWHAAFHRRPFLISVNFKILSNIPRAVMMVHLTNEKGFAETGVMKTNSNQICRKFFWIVVNSVYNSWHSYFRISVWQVSCVTRKWQRVYSNGFSCSFRWNMTLY